MPEEQPIEDSSVLIALEPRRVARLAERLEWHFDGNATIDRRASFDTRAKAMEFMAWIVRRVSRTPLDLRVEQRGGEVAIYLTPSVGGLTTSDLRMARHINAKITPDPPVT